LDDAKTSRKHAELLWQQNHYVLADLGSANGVIINNTKIRKAPVKAGDVFLIGATIFEVHPIPAPQIGPKPKDDDKEKNLSKSKMIVFGVLLFGFYLVFSTSEENVKTLRQRSKIQLTDDDDGKKKKKLDKKQLQEAINEYLPLSGKGGSGRKDADSFFHLGVRELDDGNFRRAINDFETALTVDPNHEMSKIYLKKTKKEFQDEIDNTYLTGANAEKSLRFKEACMRYQDVLRFLETDTTNKSYVKAKEALEKLVQEEKCPRQ
jgi:hypothetical protein